MTCDVAEPGSPNLTLEGKLQELRIAASPSGRKAIDRVLSKLKDVLPSGAVGVMLAESIVGEAEVALWDCFAVVFSSEVHLQRQRLAPLVPDKDLMRQILADILVWAEVSQESYDKSTAAFITEFHQGDPSFQRIGRMLMEAKADQARHGLCASEPNSPLAPAAGSRPGLLLKC